MTTGDLDPKNWDEFRARAHALLDDSLDKMSTADQGRVWTPLPNQLKAQIEQPLPRGGGDVDQILRAILPYGVGNTHPRFFGWVHGAGAPSGVLADIIAAAMNVNAGGRNHVAPVVEKQVINWCADVMGFGETASGLIVSGTSLATVVALKTARDQANALASIRGVPQGRLVGYTSNQAHSCIKRAFDLLGLGTDSLRLVPCNDAFEMDTDALIAQIEADVAAGHQPFLVAGTAGAVNMGAIDDLETIADIAAEHKLWFHVDGAFGAAGRLGTAAADRLTGIARADSLAFDFHKWFQVNYEAGLVLIRNDAAHRASFSDRAEYLRGTERGLAGGAFWAVDYGPELSRGFRALKVWAHLVEHGFDALGATIDRNIALAGALRARIVAHERLQPMAPTPLNINCFRYTSDRVDMDILNTEIVIALQESGVAVPSTTVLNGETAIRVNITNHRTQESDLDVLIEAVVEQGARLEKVLDR
ncbi:cytochrome d ubiquinol oxidase subunit I [Amylibacter marinus]|uniref:Cytochrome d ubiquinol oxidase subunit I n=1 Tax=Amylibacter marinus TaxID=1475483 RepID=A0ABQ5VTM1_9RHOB|nr:pyridoxal-dependent decarboxylase [Amylibacter marinus]GLQ34578.1 cytochrome d ubiquinol oxidase subunit I [Amylibacter marinus]